MQHGVSFAAVNAGGFTVCFMILWLLRTLGVVHFRTPSQATFAALLPSAAALVLAVLAAQQAIRYGNVVVHSVAQHFVPLLAVSIDYLASGSAPRSGELVGSLITVIGATALHFESLDMAFAATPAMLASALARTVPALVLLASALRVKRMYTLGALEIVFGCTLMSAAMLVPVVIILSPHHGAAASAAGAAGGVGVVSETPWGMWHLARSVAALLPLGLATLLHRILQMACVLELGALPRYVICCCACMLHDTHGSAGERRAGEGAAGEVRW